MSKEVTVYTPQEIEVIANQNSDKISKIDSAIDLANSLEKFIPLVQDITKLTNTIVESFFSYKKLIADLDFKIKDNKDRRNFLMKVFQKNIEHLQKITYKFLEKIEGAKNEKSKERYTNLLLDVISKTDNLTIELMKKI